MFLWAGGGGNQLVHLRKLSGILFKLMWADRFPAFPGGPCAYGAWGPWTPCSVSCGGGSTNRTRALTDPSSGCTVDPLAAADMLLCNTQPCIDGSQGSIPLQGVATFSLWSHMESRIKCFFGLVEFQPAHNDNGPIL